MSEDCDAVWCPMAASATQSNVHQPKISRSVNVAANDRDDLGERSQCDSHGAKPHREHVQQELPLVQLVLQLSDT